MEQHLIEVDLLIFQLGDKVYKIPAAGLERAETWRFEFEAQVTAILDLLNEQGEALGGIDLENLGKLADVDVMKLVPVVIQVFRRLNISLNQIGELVILYSEELSADAETIRQHATTKQTIYALKEMILVEYPFGMMGNLINDNGQAADTISKNSPSPSGA